MAKDRKRSSRQKYEIAKQGGMHRIDRLIKRIEEDTKQLTPQPIKVDKQNGRR